MEVRSKIEPFMLVGGQSGFLEQGWLAYYNLFNHDSHLFVGKLPAINLDEYGAAVLAEVNDAWTAASVIFTIPARSATC